MEWKEHNYFVSKLLTKSYKSSPNSNEIKLWTPYSTAHDQSNRSLPCNQFLGWLCQPHFLLTRDIYRVTPTTKSSTCSTFQTSTETWSDIVQMPSASEGCCGQTQKRHQLNNNRELENLNTLKGAVQHMSKLGQIINLMELCFVQITFKV